jgi:hypothetical protein
MNSYSIKQLPRTVGSTITIAGILAAQCLTPNTNTLIESRESLEDISQKRDYQTISTSSTYGNFNNPITGDFQKVVKHNFESIVSNFYANLLSNQIPLGNEFEKILYENLWDLYES